jgi:hypothetical protein
VEYISAPPPGLLAYENRVSTWHGMVMDCAKGKGREVAKSVQERIEGRLTTLGTRCFFAHVCSVG